MNVHNKSLTIPSSPAAGAAEAEAEAARIITVIIIRRMSGERGARLLAWLRAWN